MTMQRHLADDVVVVGHASEASGILRGLASLIEANYMDVEDFQLDGGTTDRQHVVAHIHTVADAASESVDNDSEGTVSREWMVELCKFLGLPWSYEKEMRATAERGTSEPVD